MDPVSHAVLGRAVTAAYGPTDGEKARHTGFAAILGALSPDVDCVLMPLGWDIYLLAHAAWTHSIVGAAVTGTGSAMIVWALRRGHARTLIVAAVLGAWSHLIADIVTGARLRPAWPLSDAVVSLPLVAMGDPWTIAILLAGAVALWKARPRLQRAARGTLLALLLALAFKGVLLVKVMRGAPQVSPRDGAAAIFESQWLTLTDWAMFERSSHELRQWRLGVTRSEPLLVLTVPVTKESPLIARSRALSTVRNFLAVHELAFAREEAGPGPGRSVFWSDIRFCWSGRHGEEPECALWFGGQFDAEGRPIRQEVRVGSWLQHRAP